MEGRRWLQFLFTAMMTLKTPGMHGLYLQRGGLLFGISAVSLLDPWPAQVSQAGSWAGGGGLPLSSQLSVSRWCYTAVCV